jgi:hypothetical protein
MLQPRRLRDLHQAIRRNARSVAQSMREFFFAYRLQQVPDGFGLERLHGVLIVCGGEDDGRRIFQRVDVPRDLDAGEAGHAHIEQHHVGTQLAAGSQRLFAVVGFADDFAVVDFGQQPPQPFARRRFVIDDE